MGSSGDFQTRAQFVTWKLLVQGQGQIHLRPRRDLAIPVDYIYQQRLIR